MRLLLLTFTVLVLLPQVTPAYGGRRRCWNNSGHCKKKCAADEVATAVCKNRQSCCVSRQGLVVFVKETITSSPSTNGWEEEAMDRIVSAASTSTYWE
uniref:Beta-defensin n=2 Tax=Bos TaxID=9903 RepID=A0A8B9XM08_BOSMU